MYVDRDAEKGLWRKSDLASLRLLRQSHANSSILIVRRGTTAVLKKIADVLKVPLDLII
jgi:hypothetical protein